MLYLTFFKGGVMEFKRKMTIFANKLLPFNHTDMALLMGIGKVFFFY